jgi:hypothetical protein
LLLKILPNGGRYWRFNYRFNGKQKTLALGVYPDVSLAKARDRLYGARDLIADGVDPAARKRAAGKTFEIVAREWHARWSAHRHARYAHYVLRRLEEDVFPSIGARVPTEIQTSAFRDVVKKIEARGALEIARRVLQNCGQIMRYAVAHDYAARNPVLQFDSGFEWPSAIDLFGESWNAACCFSNWPFLAPASASSAHQGKPEAL